MAQTKVRKAWEARIRAYRASGQSASVWCAEHQVTKRQLHVWMNKLQDSTTKDSSNIPWVKVQMDKKAETVKSMLLVRVGSTTIEVEPGYNPALLTDVIRTLQTLC
ncbi:helix-turn-helix domain-containing protein [Paenibacillus frigoriresistens]|uniref:IS66 family insertion sequence element accessory protein TnpA n=1 Tax=Paenibacillus alginolyticus TaxID=59839 RepID=UPI001564A604|nr:helix-turn-helix domain-containing protein [Paenibacillus frigoriresistens]NRF96345.1 helix-turn-helix domain-containing protein [Paenibacillus frigoriresistens]